MKADGWSELTYEDKNRQLYLEQKELLEMFMKRGAISQAQFDKSLHDLTEKMGNHALMDQGRNFNRT